MMFLWPQSQVEGRGALEMLPHAYQLHSWSDRPGHGATIPNVALGSTRTSWAYQSWSPDWPYRGHLDCGLAWGEESLEAEGFTGAPPLLLGGHAGVPGPHMRCAREPECPSAPQEVQLKMSSLCAAHLGCPLAVTPTARPLFPSASLLMAPSPPSSLPGLGPAWSRTGCCPSQRGSPMGTEVAQCRDWCLRVAVVGPW